MSMEERPGGSWQRWPSWPAQKECFTYGRAVAETARNRRNRRRGALIATTTGAEAPA